LKEEAIDLAVEKIGFGKDFGHFVRQYKMNEQERCVTLAVTTAWHCTG
jgi:hypothetical protein